MLAVALLAAYAIPYGIRARTLARRGRPVPRWRIACFGAGLVVLTIAISDPVLDLAGSTFAAHMAEHLLIADVAAVLLVLGVTGPLLAPLLRIKAIDKLRVLAHPVIAFALWAANLYLWHLSWAYEGALRHDLVHVLQHVMFLLAGINLWMPLFGPFPKPEWFGTVAQLVYVVVVRLTGAVLANVFVWSGTEFYGWYGDLADQSAAGAIMMVEESLVTVALFGWLFMKWMREGGERQEILELADARGIELDERRVARAVAAGRGAELRRRLV
ncbi:MAG TPA: cytochrome c oxidase assembly protein [Solirubrobacteraceae bacterium]|jgi:putative membrane protein|nr:cytochrome c oxidase assembly protein [Solirubrobacteraceae bacterium]